MEGQNNNEQPISVEDISIETESDLSSQNTPAPAQDNQPAPTDPNNEPAPVDNRNLDQGQNNNQQDDNQNEGGQEEQASLIKDIRDRIGVEIDVESFDETEEGVAQLATRAAEQIAQREFQRIISSDSLVRDVVQHKSNGGDPRDILYTQYPQVDYNQVVFDDANSDQHKQILRDYYRNLGEADQDIQNNISDFEQAGTLSDRAKRALEKLANMQKQQAEEVKKKQKEEEEKRLQQAKEFWDGIWNDLSGRSTINGITIPETEKRGFFDYISDPVTQDGRAKSDIDRAQRDVETQMMHDYIDYLQNVKGLSLQQLIKRSSSSAASRTLREKLNQENEKNKGGGYSPNDQNPQQTGNEEPDVETMAQQSNQQQ